LRKAEDFASGSFQVVSFTLWSQLSKYQLASSMLTLSEGFSGEYLLNDDDRREGGWEPAQKLDTTLPALPPVSQDFRLFLGAVNF
jgi:hypothetical protein